MTSKTMVFTLSLTACLFATANAFAQAPCSSGVNIVVNGVGSSIQSDAFAQAAVAITQNTSLSPSYNLVSTSAGAKVIDKRTSPPVSDTANPFWVVWDFNPTCNVYAYWTTESSAGVKDFFAYEKFTNNSAKVYSSLAASYGTITESTIASATENQIAGLADTQDSQVGVAGSAFDLIVQALNVTPETRVAAGNVQAPAYCGNLTTTSTAALTQYQCYFNVSMSEIRPEDVLYAATRALTSYNGYDVASNRRGNAITKVGTGQLTGLGYNTASSNTCGGTVRTCSVADSFNQGQQSNVVKFAIMGNDPLAGGVLPPYTTFSVGAAPILVFVHNGSQFGSTSNGVYTYNDINKQTLSQIFSGGTHCTGDLLTTSASGPGSPIQVIEREPLSATYNVFEFNAVRTLAGSSNPFFLPTGSGTSLPPESNAYNGQEQFNDPNQLPGGNGTACPLTNGFPQSNCFNPLFFENPNNECSETGYLPLRLRAVGDSEMVNATVGAYNAGAGNASVDNSIGYAFWSYRNFQSLCNTTGGSTVCPGSYIGHYLTVDGVDPLFATEGGQYDLPPNPAGAFNPPYCNTVGQAQTCFPIPFTHIYDGSYPLWSMLRFITFAPTAGKLGNSLSQMGGIEEYLNTTALIIAGYVPWMRRPFNPPTAGFPFWTGNLNLFVFRSHFLQSGIAPENGFKACNGVFTNIPIMGGSRASSTCLVDYGGDMGGSVQTVQSDVDWISDWSTEEYGLHQ